MVKFVRDEKTARVYEANNIKDAVMFAMEHGGEVIMIDTHKYIIELKTDFKSLLDERDRK